MTKIIARLTLIAGLGFWTLAPYGGCSCYNANPLQPSAGSTGPAPLVKTPKLIDFETSTTTNLWGGSVTAVANGTGSVPSHSSNITYATASGSTLTGGTSGTSAWLSGTMGQDGAPYDAYAQFDLNLGAPPTDLATYAPTHALSFSFKANAASVGKQVYVNFIDTTITDYCWYRFIWTPSNTAWKRYTVYFPGGAGPLFFAQPSWGTPRPWPSVEPNVTHVMFQPVAGASSALPFDYQIDDITFQ